MFYTKQQAFSPNNQSIRSAVSAVYCIANWKEGKKTRKKK